MLHGTLIAHFRDLFRVAKTLSRLDMRSFEATEAQATLIVHWPLLLTSRFTTRYVLVFLFPLNFFSLFGQGRGEETDQMYASCLGLSLSLYLFGKLQD